jgi:N-acetylneuraminic acid mutarotase
VKDRYLYIFGGFDGKHRFNQLYSYDCWKNVWRKHEPQGTLPQKRWYHAIALCGDSIFIYGGEAHNKYLSDMFEVKLNSRGITFVDCLWDVTFIFE